MQNVVIPTFTMGCLHVKV